MLENCVIIEVCDQRNLYRTGLGSQNMKYQYAYLSNSVPARSNVCGYLCYVLFFLELLISLCCLLLNLDLQLVQTHLDTSTWKYRCPKPKLYFKYKSLSFILSKLAPHPKFMHITLISLGHETKNSRKAKSMGFGSRLPGYNFCSAVTLDKLYFPVNLFPHL